jgi:hypothetical protein
MSRTRTSGTPISGTTPFPNALLDKAMPRLKDTEWRLLCVIVRQTLGWQDQVTQTRKEHDWLNRAQLKARTGRNNEALSLAIHALVTNGYITVRNSRGRLLATPSERRRNHSRIYYGLSRQWKEKLNMQPGEIQCQKSEHSISKQHHLQSSVLRASGAKSELVSAGKPDTTKETLTKEIVTKGDNENSLSRLTRGVFSEDASEPESGNIQSVLSYAGAGLEHSSEMRDFNTLFEQMHKKLKNREADVALTALNQERLTKLLASFPSLNWTPVLTAFLSSESGHVARRDHSLPAFLDSCHIFLIKAKPKRSSSTMTASWLCRIGADFKTGL